METQKHTPKIVIIGAGSLFFGRKLVWAMNHLEGLTNGHLALVDTDPAHLEGMSKLAEKAREASGAGYAISASEDYRDVLEGADFVILSFSRDNAHYRGVDCRISEKYGIRMCSGDTIGPGGIFRALRELPEILEIADAVADICPKAWLINYINPSSVNGIALTRHGRTRTFALCDGLHLPYLKRDYMKMIGLDPDDIAQFDLRIAGVNHFTWMLEARYRGRDVMPEIHEAMRVLGEEESGDRPAKEVYNRKTAAQLADFFGYLPVCVAHSKEYLPYWQGYGPILEKELVPPLKIFEHDTRQEVTDEMWREVAAYGSGEKEIAEFLKDGASDHATDIIQAIWNGSDRHFYVNLPNGGACPNLPADAFLELECVLTSEGPRPLPVPEMPLGLRSLQMQILDTHELTVEAFFKKDRNLLLRALAVDPIVNSLACAEAVLTDLYEAEKEVLEDWIATPGEKQNTGSVVAHDTVHQGQTKIN